MIKLAKKTFEEITFVWDRKTWLTLPAVLLLVCCHNKAQEPRKTNFPKAVEYVEVMPRPDSLWIFVMAGQSNMAGRGFVEPQDTISNKRILTLDASGKWIYAKEPLHYYEPKLTGLDCGLSFANSLLQKVPKGLSIGILPCAVGGSAIEQWLADETFRGVQLLSNFKTKVAKAQEVGSIKGILWHQGESNAKAQLIPGYKAHLRDLMAKFRTVAKNDSLPIFIGQLGAYAEPIEKQNRWNAINSIINEFTRTNDNIYIIQTLDLNHKGDKVHFDSKSQRLMGKRFAQKFLEATNNTD